MHIFYVSHTHPQKGAILQNVGGMQRVSQQLIQELERIPYIKITKATVNVAGDGLVGLKTFRFLIRELIKLPKQVKTSGADIVLFSSMVTASLSYFVRNRISAPMVTINHGRDVTLPHSLYQRFVPKIFSSLDGVISVSEATRQECISRGMEPEKGVSLPNGFDLNKLNEFPEKTVSRNFLQNNLRIPVNGRFILLSVGRNVKRKGHEWFIREVLPKIKEKVVYITIGDGPEFDNIAQAAQESEFNKYVHLLGRQPDDVLKKTYAAADLFVMPNIPVEGDMEGFGIVLLEANMARTPAVASDLEGIKDVITEGKNGYLVPPLNAEEFAKQVDGILKTDLEQLSEQTRIYVKDKFSWERIAKQYISYLRSVMDSQ